MLLQSQCPDGMSRKHRAILQVMYGMQIPFVSVGFYIQVFLQLDRVCQKYKIGIFQEGEMLVLI